MRRFLLVLVPVVLVLVSGCSGSPVAPEVLAGQGTVHYNSLEGGFWEIEVQSGERYEAYVIPEALRSEGQRVEYVGRLRGDLVTAHMAGPLLELHRIEAVSD